MYLLACQSGPGCDRDHHSRTNMAVKVYDRDITPTLGRRPQRTQRSGVITA